MSGSESRTKNWRGFSRGMKKLDEESPAESPTDIVSAALPPSLHQPPQIPPSRSILAVSHPTPPLLKQSSSRVRPSLGRRGAHLLVVRVRDDSGLGEMPVRGVRVRGASKAIVLADISPVTGCWERPTRYSATGGAEGAPPPI